MLFDIGELKRLAGVWWATGTGLFPVFVRGKGDSFHQYFERNISFRNITTLNFDRAFADGSRLFIKQSLAFFGREITTPGYRFKGTQFNSYTDASYARAFGRHAIVVGGSAVFDQFTYTQCYQVTVVFKAVSIDMI